MSESGETRGGLIYGAPFPLEVAGVEPPKVCIIPELCVVVLIGSSGSGKSTFAKAHFKPSEILEADAFRCMVSDTAQDQQSTKDAFELLYNVADKRLRRGKLVVIDATNVQNFALEQVADLAKRHYVRMVGFVFDLSVAACLENNTKRERVVEEYVIRKHVDRLRYIKRGLRKYNLRSVWEFKSNEEASKAVIERVRSRHYKHFEDDGPFDIIGDVHGCHEELRALLTKLGYRCSDELAGDPRKWFDFKHPDGRKAVFVGDYVDRGPGSDIVLDVVRAMEECGSAYCLPGNHDVRLARKLRKGTPEELLKKTEKLTHGLKATLECLHRRWTCVDILLAPETKKDIQQWCEGERRHLIEWLEGLPSHLILAHGRLVVSHAGLREEMIGRSHGAVREFCLYSNPTGTFDDSGFPNREDWAKDYRGKALIVYGHIHAGVAEFKNNTICVDTNVAIGGTLTALRYPEQELVSVPAKEVYYTPPPREKPPVNPTECRDSVGIVPSPEGVPTEVPTECRVSSIVGLSPEGSATVERLLKESSPPNEAMKALVTGPGSETVKPFTSAEGLIDIGDLIEKRSVDTRLVGPVRFRRDEAAAALEQIGRFGIDPRWLIYLPPTMSPCESAPDGDLLERPEEAFAYYRDRGVPWVVCEEKHMGSRLIAVVCRDEKVALERFGVRSGTGACYTRLGRPFFPKREIEQGVLNEIRVAMDRSGLWDVLQTNWICLDCELMPWSAKASGLLQRQYAGTGRAGRMALRAETHELVTASMRGWVEGTSDPEIQEPDQSTLKEMAGRWHCREAMMEQYVEAYRRYCWPTNGMKGLKLAPFHVMATEGHVHVDKTHLWHIDVVSDLAKGSDLLVPTLYRYVKLIDSAPDVALEREQSPWAGGLSTPVEATEWWHKTTSRETEEGLVADVEGMVVKPLDFSPPQDTRPMRDPRVAGLVQPAIKCRGREYLRIIYGPEYTAQLEQLRKRGLGTKRRAAIQEFALGVEGLERFVRREPLARVHECAFAVLALECEPLDPRL